MLGLSASLGREGYTTFAAACSAVGVHYVCGVRQAELHVLPRLVASLAAVGFGVDVAPELSDALCARAREIRGDVVEAAKRMDAIDLVLRESGKSLFAYQRDGVQRLSASTSLLLGDAMGVGKTAQTLMALPPGARVLVVCPAIMKGAIVDGQPRGGWASETRMWRPDFGITLLSGRGSFRWPKENEVVVTNYDILPPTPVEIEEDRIKHDKKRKKDQAAGEFTTHPPAQPAPEGVFLVADEIHMLGNAESGRSLRFSLLSRMVRAAGGRAWGLTGTPLMNKPDELYAVLDCLGLAQLAFGSWANYMRLYDAHRVKVNERRWQILWNSPSPDVPVRLKTVMLRREKKDVMEQLPQRVHKTLVVDVGKAALAICNEVMAELDKAGIDVAKALEIADSASGGVVFSLVSKVRKALAEAKAPYALKLAEDYEAAETPVVVFSAHLAIPALFVNRKGWGTITGDGGTICTVAGQSVPVSKSEVAVRLRKGEIQNVSGTIAAMGVGLDGLQDWISHAVFADKLWTPGANDQAVSRIERLGQKANRLHITSIMANHVLDHRVDEVLAKKERLFAAVIEAASTRPGETPDTRITDIARELERVAALVPPPWRM